MREEGAEMISPIPKSQISRLEREGGRVLSGRKVRLSNSDGDADGGNNGSLTTY